MYPHTITSNTINLFIDGRMRTVDKSHMNHGALLSAIKNGDWSRVRDLVDIPSFIADITEGRVQANEHAVLFDGKPAHGAIVTRIMGLIQQGLPVTPYARFMDRLMNNPLVSAREELFIWLESNNMPITPDGYLLAFKKVHSNYFSYATGRNGERVRNMIGDKPSMPREEVDPNRYNTCSRGLHFCSYEYLPSYYGGEGRVMVVKIDPADVVAIPNDYNNAKGRAWTYEVVDEVPEDEAKTVFEKSTLYTGYTADDSWDEDSDVDNYDDWPVNSDHCDDLSCGCEDEPVAGSLDDNGDDDYYPGTDEDDYRPPITHDDGSASPDDDDNTLVFEHNGKSYDENYVHRTVALHGQRGFSRLTGVPRSTVQGWLDHIAANDLTR